MLHGRGEEAIDCANLRAEFGAYLQGSLSRERRQALHGHLRICADCRAGFAQDVGCASELARAPRAERARRARQQRRARQRGLALAGALQGRADRLRGARLRLLLMPALAIFLMTTATRRPVSARDVRAQALGGAVWLDRLSLSSEVAPRVMLRGEGCSTGADGKARLGSGLASVELEPSALAWLESHAPARFRLGEGRFTLRGDLTASTRWGVLECSSATAEVLVEHDGLELAVHSGRVRCFDRHGARVLGPGERTRMP